MAKWSLGSKLRGLFARGDEGDHVDEAPEVADVTEITEVAEQPQAQPKPERSSRRRAGAGRRARISDDTWEDLEATLLAADFGPDVTEQLVEQMRRAVSDSGVSDADDFLRLLREQLETKLAAYDTTLNLSERPAVILVVGVNGAGKTTTIGKLASQFAGDGKKVMLAAGDTFRAAAIEQLKIWGERIGAPVIARDQGADAAGIAFDAGREAQEQSADVLLMETAGRLQNRTELMAELEKVVRVMKKVDAQAPHAVLLVLDATVGQNALNQVEIFGKVAGVTGLVMTKLDGTARGGILVAIAERFALPVHYIGVGEGREDLEPFEARDFADAIAGIER